MHKMTLSALIGLAGAISNNGKTEDTDQLVKAALTTKADEDLRTLLHREKFRISPNCETCPSPCGNTSDYPPERFDSWPDDARLLKEQVLAELQRIAGAAAEETPLPEIVYKAIAYIGFDLENAAYQRLLEEMKKW